MNIISNIQNMFSKKEGKLNKEEVAKLLQTSPELLDKFEKAYWESQKEHDSSTDNFFQLNSRMMSDKSRKADVQPCSNLEIVIESIVEELLVKSGLLDKQELLPVSRRVLETFPIEVRPQLSGTYMTKELSDCDSYPVILGYYKEYLRELNPDKKLRLYMRFLQGLDLLDLDSITYEILGRNPNSIEHWFPQLEEGIKKQEFFKIPVTKFIKVPLSILQLTRLDYLSLTPSTLKIVDEFCMRAFDLDPSKEYFIKTGTYSSKFDFRNAKVAGEKEVRELGQYLLFIHHQALQMASMLNNIAIPGVSTTNVWCVREFIPDVEKNPCIYKGMPLHTEYRFFVDFDDNIILGVSPYWREDVMKENFLKVREGDVDKMHDYIVYTAHQDILYGRYQENLELLKQKMLTLLPKMDLSGQWSIDVMQNGNDFYIIDMALANQSALNDVIPLEKMKQQTIDWLPKLEMGDVVGE